MGSASDASDKKRGADTFLGSPLPQKETRTMPKLAGVPEVDGLQRPGGARSRRGGRNHQRIDAVTH